MALHIYLAGAMYEAVEGLCRLHPYEAPKPPELWDRFVGWAAHRRRP